MSINPKYIEQLEHDDLLLADVKKENVLVVHNDDVNTFDWVIESLVEICEHSLEQAEQCALFIHHKGKYGVKSGSLNRLKPMKNGLTDRGIDATIQ